MKVVVNRCYGGFGISIKAQLEIHQRGGCPHQKIEPRSQYFGGDSWKGFYKSEKEYQEQHLKMCEIAQVNGEILYDEHRDYENRTCPKLIEVVEELKEKAFGQHAELEVVEIPDDVKYEIDDYDGIETIHEEHRSW